MATVSPLPPMRAGGGGGAGGAAPDPNSQNNPWAPDSWGVVAATSGLFPQPHRGESLRSFPAPTANPLMGWEPPRCVGSQAGRFS